jgi:hypothetical protein
MYMFNINEISFLQYFDPYLVESTDVEPAVKEG